MWMKIEKEKKNEKIEPTWKAIKNFNTKQSRVVNLSNNLKSNYNIILSQKFNLKLSLVL